MLPINDVDDIAVNDLDDSYGLEPFALRGIPAVLAGKVAPKRWITKDGRDLALEDLEQDHLKNLYLFLERAIRYEDADTLDFDCFYLLLEKQEEVWEELERRREAHTARVFAAASESVP